MKARRQSDASTPNFWQAGQEERVDNASRVRGPGSGDPKRISSDGAGVAVHTRLPMAPAPLLSRRVSASILALQSAEFVGSEPWTPYWGSSRECWHSIFTSTTHGPHHHPTRVFPPSCAGRRTNGSRSRRLRPLQTRPLSEGI
jgi:hypothetical protein